MKRADLRSLLLLSLGTGIALALSSCATGPTVSTRQLPAYELPIAKANIQQVRTTAYTDTEADHRQFTNHTALGGVLRSATTPGRRVGSGYRSSSSGRDNEASQYQRVAYVSGSQPFSLYKAAKARSQSSARTKNKRRRTEPMRIGSAAADWARWPAGTTFRILSTGQIYRVEDYGWALAGRNTIDLYVSNPTEMNHWGARVEPIEVLSWGDPAESLRRLASHTEYKHIRRMVLELQGQHQAAAQLQ